ncbi:hypothetical protein RRG08_005013 [Elysia crispata]|uniref:Uncharacterized protein n=1 Tax=Elysia crispata TaxID=231223 RepID=A0AAE1E974_9GAST|nr:hypothetical protein RRG08_005013 [Elysia crispata]
MEKDGKKEPGALEVSPSPHTLNIFREAMYTSAAACKQLHVTQYNKFSLGLQCGKLYISNVSSGLWRSHPVLIP